MSPGCASGSFLEADYVDRVVHIAGFTIYAETITIRDC